MGPNLVPPKCKAARCFKVGKLEDYECAGICATVNPNVFMRG